MAVLSKPFYDLEEVCSFWGLRERDLTAFVLAGELTLSATVAGLRVHFGYMQEIDTDYWERLPEGTRHITGTIDLERDDAWRVLREGQYAVMRLKSPEEEFIEVADDPISGGTHMVCRDDLVVCRAEIERFEKAHPELATSSEAKDAEGSSESLSSNAEQPKRGAPPKYDWEGFWIETCRHIHDDGVPETQGQLVRAMLDWFSETGQRVPDASTVKKKLSPLWRKIGPHAIA